MSAIRAVSYGGGTQSTALLVLAGKREIDYPLFLYAHLGEKAEPGTVSYIRRFAIPYAKEQGIELVPVVRRRRDGTTESLWDRINREGSRSIDIPVRMSNGAPGHRRCTEDFKIKPVAKELKRRGATLDEPATLAVGISLDEIRRSRNNSGFPYIKRVEPLIDLRLTKSDCQDIISRAGLPLPPKSSCVWCPYQTMAQWKSRKTNDPEGFANAVEVERVLQERRVMLGKDAVYLSSALIPLDQIKLDFNQEELDLDALGVCDTGYCMR